MKHDNEILQTNRVVEGKVEWKWKEYRTPRSTTTFLQRRPKKRKKPETVETLRSRATQKLDTHDWNAVIMISNQGRDCRHVRSDKNARLARARFFFFFPPSPRSQVVHPIATTTVPSLVVIWLSRCLFAYLH